MPAEDEALERGAGDAMDVEDAADAPEEQPDDDLLEPAEDEEEPTEAGEVAPVLARGGSRPGSFMGNYRGDGPGPAAAAGSSMGN